MSINATCYVHCIVTHCLLQFLHFMPCAGVPLDMTETIDIHAVTGALKLYLRELPIPLITFEVFEQLLGTLDGMLTLLDYAELVLHNYISFSNVLSSVYSWYKCETRSNYRRLLQLPTSASTIACKCSEVLNEALKKVCIPFYLTIIAHLHTTSHTSLNCYNM